MRGVRLNSSAVVYTGITPSWRLHNYNSLFTVVCHFTILKRNFSQCLRLHSSSDSRLQYFVIIPITKLSLPTRHAYSIWNFSHIVADSVAKGACLIRLCTRHNHSNVWWDMYQEQTHLTYGIKFDGQWLSSPLSLCFQYFLSFWVHVCPITS